jgi:hypothetical protein
LSSIGAIWLVCDRNRTNFYKIYGRFEEIGLLDVEAVFVWHEQIGLDVLSGIEGKWSVKKKITNLFLLKPP